MYASTPDELQFSLRVCSGYLLICLFSLISKINLTAYYSALISYIVILIYVHCVCRGPIEVPLRWTDNLSDCDSVGMTPDF